MFRIPFTDAFSLRFVFEDLDGFPVSVADADLDFLISTRHNTSPVKAFIHDSKSCGAMRLQDGSVLVKINPKALFPGKVKAIVYVNAGDENSLGSPKHPQVERFCPTAEVPVEIIDGNPPSVGHHHHDHHHKHYVFNPDVPVTVKCRFNIRNPQLSKHVTRGELKEAVENAMCDCQRNELASAEDIADILTKFDISD